MGVLIIENRNKRMWLICTYISSPYLDLKNYIFILIRVYGQCGYSLSKSGWVQIKLSKCEFIVISV